MASYRLSKCELDLKVAKNGLEVLLTQSLPPLTYLCLEKAKENNLPYEKHCYFLEILPASVLTFSRKINLAKFFVKIKQREVNYWDMKRNQVIFVNFM